MGPVGRGAPRKTKKHAQTCTHAHPTQSPWEIAHTHTHTAISYKSCMRSPLPERSPVNVTNQRRRHHMEVEPCHTAVALERSLLDATMWSRRGRCASLPLWHTHTVHTYSLLLSRPPKGGPEGSSVSTSAAVEILQISTEATVTPVTQTRSAACDRQRMGSEGVRIRRVLPVDGVLRKTTLV